MSHKLIWFSALILSLTTAYRSAASSEGDAKTPAPPRLLTVPELAARIDALIEADLAGRGVEPAPLASDAEFLRRVYLDLAGRIPSENDVRTFLADRSPDRRARLVESLLGSPLYVQNMANAWEKVMSPSDAAATVSQPIFRMWLESSVQANAPYDRMVRELFTSPSLQVRNVRNYYSGGTKLLIRDKKKRVVDPNRNPMNLLPKEMAPNPIPKIREVLPSKDTKERTKEIEDLIEKATRELEKETIEIVQVVPTGPNGVTQVTTQVAVSPGMYFFETNGFRPESLAASTSRRFLGVRLECAQCHNHPFAPWTRKQFWEFATFFTTVASQQGIYGKGLVEKFGDFNEPFDVEDLKLKIERKGESKAIAQPLPAQPIELSMMIPGTDKVVKARFLDGQAPDLKANVESRQTLAEWLTSPTNPYFARTAANRLWAHFFGTGIIDPIDEEPSDENPASHPELMDELTTQFVANKFDVKYLIRAITLSKAYQRASAATYANQSGPRLFARMAVRAVTPAQLFDNIALATGFQNPGVPDAIYTTNINVNRNSLHIAGDPRSEFLAMFTSQEKSTETPTSILQALTLMNGKLITDATSLTTNQKLTTLLNGSLPPAEKIESLFLSTLSRLPRSEETARMVDYVNGQPEPFAAYTDVLWALLNSAEFRFNH